VRDQQRMAALGREHRHLQPLVELGARVQRIEQELAETRELLRSDDPDMAAEAGAEQDRLEAALDALLGEIRPALIPHDPLDDRPAIVEIRGGAGGDEAAIFAADLYRMYTRFAEGRRWRVEVISQSDGTLGGMKEAIFKVKGEGAFGVMRWESGVHRVQRVPVTESQGRIHTSAATVAVLPEAEEIDLKIEDKDLRIDVFRSSGPGGQSVNTTDSAVRITHVPTGIVVSCQNEKSQLQNREQAMRVLRSRLLQRAQDERDAEASDARRSQIRTVDRSERIRTYNFAENRITDHRVGYKAYNLDQVLDGDLGAVIEACVDADLSDRLAAVESAGS